MMVTDWAEVYVPAAGEKVGVGVCELDVLELNVQVRIFWLAVSPPVAPVKPI
jgi:hypothetical protein